MAGERKVLGGQDATQVSCSETCRQFTHMVGPGPLDNDRLEIIVCQKCKEKERKKERERERERKKKESAKRGVPDEKVSKREKIKILQHLHFLLATYLCNRCTRNHTGCRSYYYQCSYRWGSWLYKYHSHLHICMRLNT